MVVAVAGAILVAGAAVFVLREDEDELRWYTVEAADPADRTAWPESSIATLDERHVAAFPEPARAAWEEAVKTGRANFTLTASEADEMFRVIQEAVEKEGAEIVHVYEFRGTLLIMSGIIH